MSKHSYYRDGQEISEAEALDHRGMVRDQVTVRVRTIMRDSNGRALFTDCGSNDPTAGNRPGWRIPINDDRRRAVVRDAYREYETRLQNTYKLHDGQHLCPDCAGSGLADDNEACDGCGGSGVKFDTGYGTDPDEALGNTVAKYDGKPATLDQMMKAHHERMQQLYAKHDAQLENAWRQK